MYYFENKLPSSSGLGHRPLTAVTGVRFPLGVPVTTNRQIPNANRSGRAVDAAKATMVIVASYITVSFWDRIGSKVVTMHPDRHDEIVARVSHLPHLAASALCSLLGRYDPNSQHFGGGGLRDTTRVAGGSPDLWLEILLENRDEVLRALTEYQDEVQRLHAALANRDTPELLSLLQRE